MYGCLCQPSLGMRRTLAIADPTDNHATQVLLRALNFTLDQLVVIIIGGNFITALQQLIFALQPPPQELSLFLSWPLLPQL